MYCSGCGHALVPGQPVCPQCGRPQAPAIPPIPGLQFQVDSYASRVRALSIVWFIYAGLSLVLGVIALSYANAFLSGHRFPWGDGNWADGPFRPEWFGPAIVHFVWVVVVIRAALALAAGYGLMERAPWGRVVAIVAAFLNLLKFPFGTAIGIWTLVTLMGYRNNTLYDQLP